MLTQWQFAAPITVLTHGKTCAKAIELALMAKAQPKLFKCHHRNEPFFHEGKYVSL